MVVMRSNSPEAVSALNHASVDQPFATTCSSLPVDTSQLLSEEAGEVNLLRLRDTNKEHRVKVCVLAPLVTTIVATEEVQPHEAGI
jgi:hypothetical protein